MKKIYLLLLVTLVIAATAYADDIDIYGVSDIGDELKPNVLIILDNSGSMSTEDVPGDPYDPDTIYSGYSGPDRVAREYNGDWYEYFPDINSSNWNCEQARDQLINLGFWSGKLYKNDGVVSCTDSGTIRDYRLVNYINYLYTDSNKLSRMEVAKEVVAKLIVDNSENVKFGLMAFNEDSAYPYYDYYNHYSDYYGNGGYIVAECGSSLATLIGDYDPTADNMDDSSQPNYGAVGLLKSDTNTPLAETLGEAGLYFAGKKSWFNSPKTGYPLGYYSHSCTDDNSSCQDYGDDSPIEWRCQKNYIVLVTDGEPTQDDDKFSDFDYIFDERLTEQQDGNTSYLDDVSEFLNQNDILPISDSPTEAERLLKGSVGDFEDQTVTTFTVGFKTDQDLLQSTATRGGGEYFTANSAAELGESLTNIISAIGDNNEMFTAATVPVSSEDGVFAGNYIYLGLFQPTSQGGWLGNVKKYGLSGGNILDSQGNHAASANGTIYDNAISYWSSAPDGQDVAAGGAGEVLRDRSSARNIYTYTGTSADLTDSSNNFISENTSLTDSYPELTAEIIDGVRSGVDSDWPLGSVLHFQPVVEHFDTDADGDNDQTVVFAGANDGMLHCFDDTDGEELWAYIPHDLLQNVDILPNAESLSYFVDGNAVIYRYDHDDDSNTPDKKIILFGERRGGYAYTALDISTFNSPRYKYSVGPDILGQDDENLGQSWGTPQMCRMGYMDGSDYLTKEVFVMPGGYDLNQDADTPASNDNVGRAVYAIDAQTGALFGNFKFSNANYSDMTHSIIAVSAFENPLSRNTTRVYAGDMGGNLFAFRDDIFHRNQIASRKDDYGGLYDGQEDGNWEQKLKLYSVPGRKIWYQPNIVNEYFPVEFTYPADETGSGEEEVRTERRAGDYVFFGTGDRSRPNETSVENRFYAVKNNWQWSSENPSIVEAYVDETDGGKIKAKDDNRVIVDQQRINGAFSQVEATDPFILDVTDDLIQNQEENEDTRVLYSNYVKDALRHPLNKGWFIRFVEGESSLVGEKLVSSPQIYQGVVMFTTFVPEPEEANDSGSDSDPCSSPGSSGTGYFYAIDYMTGGAVFNFDSTNDETGEDGEEEEVIARPDRRFKLAKSGIPPAPTVIVEQDETTILVGTQKIDLSFNRNVERMFWRRMYRD
jgi:type IV pilus assembly protein PilY1